MPVIADLGLLDTVVELLYSVGVDLGKLGIDALIGGVDEYELWIRDYGSLAGARDATEAVGVNGECVANFGVAGVAGVTRSR